MHRRAFERHLFDHGCEWIREGKHHTVWHKCHTFRHALVPRYDFVAPTVLRAVCRQLGIPQPL